MKINLISFGQNKILEFKPLNAAPPVLPPLQTDSVNFSDMAKKTPFARKIDSINKLFQLIKQDKEQYETVRKQFLDILCDEKTENQIITAHKNSNGRDNSDDVFEFFGAALLLGRQLEKFGSEDEELYHDANDCLEVIDSLLEDCEAANPGIFVAKSYYGENSYIELEPITQSVELGLSMNQIMKNSPNMVRYMKQTIELTAASDDGSDEANSENDLMVIVPTHANDFESQDIIKAFKVVMKIFEKVKNEFDKSQQQGQRE